MINLYDFVHDTLGMCFWTLPALIVAAAMIVIGLCHRHKQKKRQKNFDKKLENV